MIFCSMLAFVCVCVWVCVCVCVRVCMWQAKRKYYDKSQQSDTAQMTVKDAQALKSSYAPKKWENVR